MFSKGSGSDQDYIERVFKKAAELMNGLGKVRSVQDSFFLPDGAQTHGTLLYVGGIAAYGLSAEGGGALAPAGDDRLKVVQADFQLVESLSNGEFPNPLPIFLYENASKAVELKKGKSILEHVNAGGIIGWVIVILGALAMLMVLLRAMFLSRSGARTGDLLSKLIPLVQNGFIAEAQTLLKKRPSAAARVLSATINNLDRRREHLEDIISEGILHETPYLDRFGSTILVFAAVAPLLGLLGTVTGMISTFDVITEFGTGDPKLLSGGISEALITTELGLIVAIPSLLLGNLLTGMANQIKDDMEHAALRVVNEYQTGSRSKVIWRTKSESSDTPEIAGESGGIL